MVPEKQGVSQAGQEKEHDQWVEVGATEANRMETLASKTLPQSPHRPCLPLNLDKKIQEDGGSELLGLKR